MLVNRKALEQVTGLSGDDLLLVLAENVKQKNAGNKGITVDNFITAIESLINDVVGNLEVTGDLTVAGESNFTSNINTQSNIDIALMLSTDTISEHTAAAGVTVDGALIKDGGISANSMYAGFFPTAAAQALSGAGAVNITSYLTKYTSTGGAQALTIASGTQIGQRKKVSHVVDGGSGVLTGVFIGGTTITFTTVGEFADLLWGGSSWGVLELGNTATPGTPPVLA